MIYLLRNTILSVSDLLQNIILNIPAPPSALASPGNNTSSPGQKPFFASASSYSPVIIVTPILYGHIGVDSGVESLCCHNLVEIFEPVYFHAHAPPGGDVFSKIDGAARSR